MSSITDDERQELLGQLVDLRQTANRLKTALKFKGKDADADKVEEGIDKLTKAIDKLLAAALKDWLDDAAGVEADLKQANEKLEASIDDIKSSVETAQKVVKAIGFIDDAIRIGAKLLKPI